jgi:hypothetical protein
MLLYATVEVAVVALNEVLMALVKVDDLIFQLRNIKVIGRVRFGLQNLLFVDIFPYYVKIILSELHELQLLVSFEESVVVRIPAEQAHVR